MAPFLLEGNRIIGMLTGPDLLRLYLHSIQVTRSGCVNSLLHEATVRDAVWNNVFKHDSKEDLDIVLKNEWVLKRWNLINPPATTVESTAEVE